MADIPLAHLSRQQLFQLLLRVVDILAQRLSLGQAMLAVVLKLLQHCMTRALILEMLLSLPGAGRNTVMSGALPSGGNGYALHQLDPGAAAFYPVVPTVSRTLVSQVQNGVNCQPFASVWSGF